MVNNAKIKLIYFKCLLTAVNAIHIAHVPLMDSTNQYETNEMVEKLRIERETYPQCCGAGAGLFSRSR